MSTLTYMYSQVIDKFSDFIVLRIQLLVLPPEELDELVDELGELPALVAPFRAAGFPPECFHNDSDSESPPVPPPPPWKTSL